MELASRALGKYREWDVSKRYGLTPNELMFELLCPWMQFEWDLRKLKKHMHSIGESKTMEKMRRFILGDKELHTFVEEILNVSLQEHVRIIKYIEDWRLNYWGFRKTV